MTTFITTADLRAYVNNAKAADEAQLQRAVDVACAAVEDGYGDLPGCGPILSTSLVEVLDGGATALVLGARASAVTSVETYPAGVALTAADFRVSGQILRRTDGGTIPAVEVTYATGYDEAPAWAREAALTIAAHYWQTRLRTPGQPQPGTGLGYLVPDQAAAMLEPHRLAPLGFA